MRHGYSATAPPLLPGYRSAPESSPVYGPDGMVAEVDLQINPIGVGGCEDGWRRGQGALSRLRRLPPQNPGHDEYLPPQQCCDQQKGRKRPDGETRTLCHDRQPLLGLSPRTRRLHLHPPAAGTAELALAVMHPALLLHRDSAMRACHSRTSETDSMVPEQVGSVKQALQAS